MILISDLQQLIDKWQERISPVQPFDYKNGIEECIYDLNQLIEQDIEEELSYQEYLELEADRCNASLETHERVA